MWAQFCAGHGCALHWLGTINTSSCPPLAPFPIWFISILRLNTTRHPPTPFMSQSFKPSKSGRGQMSLAIVSTKVEN